MNRQLLVLIVVVAAIYLYESSGKNVPLGVLDPITGQSYVPTLG